MSELPAPYSASTTPATTEASRQLHHFQHLLAGNGLDVASGGQPIVPWAISLDLPDALYSCYNNNQPPRGTVNWRGDALNLPLRDQVCDWVLASHILEDFQDWLPPVQEWTRVLKPGGHLILLMPDRTLFAQAIARGQPPNLAHKHESYPGEFTSFTSLHGLPLHVLYDSLTLSFPNDYNLLIVARRL